ncbi:MAG: hypothetical protein ACLGIF_06270 [Actinomycetes bacterium]
MLAPTHPLIHGGAIPVLGLGTWPMRGAEAVPGLDRGDAELTDSDVSGH